MSEPLFRKKELILLAVISVLLIGIIVLPRFIKPGSGTVAVVTYNGETVAEISLDEPDTYTVEGDLTATLVVENGKIRFVNSKCPDKICEAFGWIGRPGESAVCAPARLAVQIKD